MNGTGRVRKLISAAMAVMLLSIMVPTLPQESANAGQGGNQAFAQGSGEGTSLITSWTYYDENWIAEGLSNSFEQSDAANALFNSTDAQKPSATKIVNSALAADSSAFDAAMKDAVESAYKDTAQNYSVDAANATLTAYKDVTPACTSDGNILSVSAENDVWSFTASGVGSATVNASISEVSAHIPFTYEVPAASSDIDSDAGGKVDAGTDLAEGGEGIDNSNPEGGDNTPSTETKSGTIDVDVACPEGTSTSFTITISDGKKAGSDKIENVFKDAVSLTYGDEAATINVADLRGSFASAEISGGEEFFSAQASVDHGTLAVTIAPIKAFDGEQTATLTVRSANAKDSVTAAVKVKVAKKAIEVPEQLQQPYRFADDQLVQIKADLAAADACKGVANEAGITVLDADAIAYAGSSTYPGEAGGTTAVSIAIKDSCANNYALSSDTVSVKVDAVQAEEFTKSTLALTAEGSVNQPKSNADWLNTWVNKDVTASYAGSTISKTFQGEYSESIAMNNAEGTYSNQALYAKNGTSNVVTKVTGIGYKLDKTAPVVNNFSVSDPYVVHDKIFFDKTVCDVVVNVVDKENASNMVVGNSAQGTQADVSGLDAKSVAMSYNDIHAGQSVNATLSNEGNSFKTTVDADQDVPLDTMTVTANDVAGNEMNANTIDSLQIPDAVRQLVADSAAPQVNVSFDNYDVANGSYYNAPRVATIMVTEAHFNYMQKYAADQAIVTITENGESRVFNPGSFTNIGNDTWQVVYSFANDADYSIHVKATDLVGKESGVFDDSFTVDTIAPTIDVAFDNNSATNGNYYGSSRTATITVDEHNFDPSLVNVEPTSDAGNGDTVGVASVGEWSNSGDTHVVTVHFPGEGVYTLTVSGTDLALNALPTYVCPEFIVDNITPTISVQVNGEEDASSVAYPDNAAVTVTVSDTNVSTETTVDIQAISWNNSGSPYAQNMDTSNTQIAVSYDNPASVPESDGIYSLTVNAIDMAGHSENKVVQWSVNRFGSTYLISDGTKEMIDAKYLNAEKASDVTITEINPSGIDESQSSVRLTQGITNKTLNRDSDYTLAGDSSMEGWPAYVYTVNKANYATDGLYQFTTRSVDRANHASENTMSAKNSDRTNSAEVSFSIDNTAPLCSFVGFDEGIIADSQHVVELSLEDNMQLDKAMVYVNGKLAETYNRNYLDSTPNPRLTLSESAVSQLVTVEVVDAAGNQEIYTSPQSIFVNSNPFARWLHNTPLFVGSIVGAAAVIAGLIMLLKRRRDSQEDSAN